MAKIRVRSKVSPTDLHFKGHWLQRMDRKGAKLDPQGLFQKFCAGSCTRIKAHNNGIVVNILQVERINTP